MAFATSCLGGCVAQRLGITAITWGQAEPELFQPSAAGECCALFCFGAYLLFCLQLGRFAAHGQVGVIGNRLAGLFVAGLCVEPMVKATPCRQGTRRFALALVFGLYVCRRLAGFIGQSYQQGADNWQLFAVWALLILPGWCF